jgi:chemotaxis signal transduction protein
MAQKRITRSASDIEYLSGFMLGLREDQTRLREIQGVYDNLTLLGQLLGAGTDITQMRTDFTELAQVLLNELALELRKKAILGLSSDARVAIDIMVRNLFERTADIGFLATDSDIQSFAERAIEGNQHNHELEALRRRFDEYVRKYSVYHNIILLSPSGEVLAQLDENNPVTHSADPLIRESLTTSAAYVETFRSTDLLPQDSAPLIYSFRVMSKDGASPIAVLCLCFRFHDESSRIFAGLAEEHDWTVITFMSPTGHIIASSDPYQLPVGARIEIPEYDECKIIRFAGREYLAVACQSRGYQGYMGPGWVGAALAPLNHAFDMSSANELNDVPKQLLEGVLETSTLFTEHLRNIPIRASSIQRELDRAVWNGNVWLSRDHYAMNSSFAKVLLREIGSTGIQTHSVFTESTIKLYELVVSSVLVDCSAQAALAMDIMDRNLYERANDCRWWALTLAFREILSGVDTTKDEELGRILRTINGLYTVYSNLLVFDSQGKVRAVSNPAYTDMVGQPLQADWLRQTLGLSDNQSYAVSSFSSTGLYDHRPTYVYSAAIRRLGEFTDAVGGIAIVFDSSPQFFAMLEDALPRKEDGTLVEGAFAVFAEKDGRIISSTDPDLPSGSKLVIQKEFFHLEPGGSYANIIEYRDRYYSVGSRMTNGYREYKNEGDKYRNDIVSVVLVPLSEQLCDHHKLSLKKLSEKKAYSRRQMVGEGAIEIATFYIGGNWYGVRSSSVVESIDVEDITVLPDMPNWARGCVMYQDKPITVFDLAALMSGTVSSIKNQPVVVIGSEEKNIRFGIVVDDLGEIPEFAPERFELVPGMMSSSSSITESLVKPVAGESENRILVVLSVDKMIERLSGAVPMHEEPLRLAFKD